MRIQNLLVLAIVAGCSDAITTDQSDSRDGARSGAIGEELPLQLYRDGERASLLHPRAVVDDSDPEEAARQWLASNGADLQLDESELVLEHSRQGLIGTYLRFGQHVTGLPVFDGQVIVHLIGAEAGWEIRDVNLNHALTGGYVPPKATLPEADALRIASEAVKVVGPLRYPAAVVLGVDPRNTRTLVYRIDLAPGDRTSWRVIVDARTGEVLSTTDRRRYVDGDGYIFDASPISSSGNTGLTDNNDNNQAALTAERVLVTVPRLDGSGDLTGPWVDAHPNNLGNRANEGSFSYQYNRQDNRFEEVMSYYHIDAVQNRIQSLGFANVNNRMQEVWVNGTNQDNSWYDPANTDITTGSGGVDDGEDADIIVHEYGHSIQDDQVPGWGGGEEGAMGEGFGDYMATIFVDALAVVPQLDDRFCMGAWDAVSFGTSCLRRTDGTKHYPEAMAFEVHDDGEMWAAATIATSDLLGGSVMDVLMLEHHFLMSTNESFFDAAAFLQTADQNVNGGANVDTIRRRMIQQGLSRELTAPPVLPDILQTIPVDIIHPTTAGNYYSDEDDTQTFNWPGAAGLRVHFDVFETELWGGCLDGACDNVYLTNGSGDLFQVLYGALGDTTSVIVEGDTVNIRLVSDYSVAEAGYHVDYIEIMGDAGCADDDGDGVDSCSDCDDADPNNFPGNPEVCDGADNDCDFVDDNGLAFVDYWADGDGDGYGDDSGLPTATCDGAPVGMVDNNGDCDDGRGAVNPAAGEVACDGLDNDCDPSTENNPDADGDGALFCTGDCDDNDPLRFPGNPEVSCDGIDNDCDGLTIDNPDGDGDGVDVCVDCDDGDGANFQGNPEVCDGADNDCDGVDDNGLPTFDYWNDADGDGYGDDGPPALTICGPAPPGLVANNDDCDDTRGAVNPAAAEVLCDGLDNDCSPLTSNNPDSDGDGALFCGADCDDNDPLRFPGNPEVSCDGIDNDCDGLTIDNPDGDGDGVDVCLDCDDGDGANFQGNPEVCDGADNDCDGVADNGFVLVDYWIDADGDGFGDDNGPPALSLCGPAPSGFVADNTDCDDSWAATNPAGVEILCDGRDNDCDAATSNNPDDDGDGDLYCSDCDDNDPLRFQGNPEVSCDGIDNDCDPLTIDDEDLDGDGVSVCAGDCDDLDPANFPGNAELCDSADNDCDGVDDNGVVFGDYWLDADGDGFGDGVPANTCTGPPSGYVAIDGDCDDAEAAANPGLAELTCDGIDNDCDALTEDDADVDGDGDTLCAGDCDDSDPLRFQGNPEVSCDGIDNDCDALTLDDEDFDGDGLSVCAGDCDDSDPANFPGNVEYCDSADNDCDGVDDNGVVFVDYWLDADGDGYGDGAPDNNCTGAPTGYVAIDGDCDDSDPQANPGLSEVSCDGVDNDCDALTLDDEDVDADGVSICAGDCDDSDPLRFAGNPEVACDGIDNDCDALTLDDEDVDGDGVSFCAGDCDDSDAGNFPGNVEFCDGLDNDCDGVDDNGVVFVDYYLDGDGDGYGDGAPVNTCTGPPTGHVALSGDCDDAEPLVNPGLAELTCDGLDNDCDPLTPDDGDSDGDGFSICAGDCDDTDPGVFPGGVEVACDGLDNDCDPSTSDGVDADLDGVSACGGDCDDGNDQIFPGNLEICDGLDNDCDPLTPDDPDLDGDGVSVCTGDCDDGEPAVFPGNAEISCDGLDNDCDPLTIDNPDLDGDGVFACSGDCDDGDAARFPGNAEICDGLDNNCDGSIDNGLVFDTWYADDDGDGYGDAMDTVDTCDGIVPSGFLADDTDCDDGDIDVNPAAVEIECDEIDNDCDPLTPDDATDLDADGFGACEDCDETDATIYPGAVELCNGIDEDCNGIADDGLPVLEYWPDEDGDGFGDPDQASEITCDPQLGWVADDGDCDDLDPGIHPDADELVCDGIDNDCDPMTLDEDSSCDTDDTDDTDVIPDDTGNPIDGGKTNPDSGGCACDASSGVGGGWLLLLGLLVIRRRCSEQADF